MSVCLGNRDSIYGSSFISLENGLSTAKKGVILLCKTPIRSFDKQHLLGPVLCAGARQAIPRGSLTHVFFSFSLYISSCKNNKIN